MDLDIEKESSSDIRRVKPVEWKLDGPVVQTHMSVLRGLCQVLDRSRSGRNLHLTSVRNEHAYFACVSDIVAALPSRPQEDMATKLGGKIFVIGDSHVLSSAWCTVGLPSAGGGQEPHLLTPCLVTGLKIWHLQEKSSFYTKWAFWNRIESLPRGAPVIIMMGEIDCREGVLKAVQLLRHTSIKTALNAIAELYVSVLREVKRRAPRSSVFIHPIAEVLPETRFLTLTFNELLKRKQDVLEKMGIKLLDLASTLEEGPELPDDASLIPGELSKRKLLPGLELDGTHLNPAYVQSHLAPALQKAWTAPDE